MDKTYTNIFHCKTLQYLPKLEFFVWKYAIWQPCFVSVLPKSSFPFFKVTIGTTKDRPSVVSTWGRDDSQSWSRNLGAGEKKPDNRVTLSPTKNWRKNSAFCSNKCYNLQKFDRNLGFGEKRQIFRRKVSKIAENCVHNIKRSHKEEPSQYFVKIKAYFFKASTLYLPRRDSNSLPIVPVS
jgi:hypothetical protein